MGKNETILYDNYKWNHINTSHCTVQNIFLILVIQNIFEKYYIINSVVQMDS